MRFIPTCVGNICPTPSLLNPKSVHPHVCGEHDVSGCGTSVPCGSSPRVWGTCRMAEEIKNVRRFIPTCVGNIPSLAGRERGYTVHPHVCGEHYLSAVVEAVTGGSSPRVWGTSWSITRGCIPTRFIPTCVGNMPFSALMRSYSPVHPHVCGEHLGRTCVFALPLGSSPRVWGTFL